MDRSILDLPGYYYDSEKRKYFKIQASSTAPASSAYSSSRVKRLKTRDQKTMDREAILARQKRQIRRSKVAKDCLAGGLVERAHGRSVGMDTARIFAAGMLPQGCLSGMSRFTDCSEPLFDIDHRTDLGPSMVDMRMVFDDQLFSIRVNADKYTRSTEHGSIEICHDFSIPSVNNADWRLERFGHPGASTSLSTHRESRTLAMTWISNTNHSGIAITPMPGMLNEPELDRPTILLGRAGLEDDTVWSSAAAPPNSSDLFAFGTSAGILMIDKDQCHPRTITPTMSDWRHSPKDVFALEFLNDNPSILLSGSRRGILNLIDLRLPFDGTDTIKHPSTITHIKQLDTHRILVAGLQSNLHQYDLRFRKTTTPKPQTPPPIPYLNPRRTLPTQAERRGRHTPRPTQQIIESTLPILSYPSYRNESVIKTGFDVDLESGIIAAAQVDDDESSTVQLFSLHGGEKLPSKVTQFANYEYGDDGARVVRCLKWATDVEGRGKSLYVGLGKDVQRFAWGSWEDGRAEVEG